jgi:ubiquitin C-terminal hydrolase
MQTVNFFAVFFLVKSAFFRCKVKRIAVRTTIIVRAPSVLLVQLKRFNVYGNKINLPVLPEVNQILRGAKISKLLIFHYISYKFDKISHLKNQIFPILASQNRHFSENISRLGVPGCAFSEISDYLLLIR